MRRIKLAIIATCAAVAASTITPAYAAEEPSIPEALSTAIKKDGLVKTVVSNAIDLSLFPIGFMVMLSMEPGTL